MKFNPFPNFIEVARLDDVAPGTGFRVLDRPVAVFNVAGRIFAITDRVRTRAARQAWEGSKAAS